ncbi:MAG: glycosyltransferase, partial [Gemmatimonadetes bacterium]|nr:glycosyltransferase [Gemmatimonadota bacterium]
ASQIVVVPSVPARSGDQDGLPVALLEGMAAGCAPVASDLPGIDQALEPGRSGLLVPPGDAGARCSGVAGGSAGGAGFGRDRRRSGCRLVRG